MSLAAPLTLSWCVNIFAEEQKKDLCKQFVHIQGSVNSRLNMVKMYMSVLGHFWQTSIYQIFKCQNNSLLVLSWYWVWKLNIEWVTLFIGYILLLYQCKMGVSNSWLILTFVLFLSVFIVNFFCLYSVFHIILVFYYYCVNLTFE